MPLPFPLFGRAKAPGPIEWLLVGLGNPGPKYALSRHNVGFHVVDKLAAAEGLTFDERRHGALLARGTVAGAAVALVKPQTFMNHSGKAVAPLARFYKVPPPNILVIVDDVDLNPAQLRVRRQGGSGGHKGMTSLIEHLGSNQFPRLRIGIGRPPGRIPVEAFVLQKFTPAEWEAMDVTCHTALDAVRAVLQHGVEYAMNNFNTK
ncbi:MAG: aminoacyl-tRNA hydrolase [Anaerolineae bacterium]